MTIQNGLGVAGYSRRLSRGFAGQPIGDVKCRPFRNAIRPQISTVTIAGFGADADSFTIEITKPDGTVVEACTITRAGGSPADDTAAAAAAVTAINAVNALRGHVVATSALGVITLTFQHPNIEYTVASSVTACTATVATSQTAGGTSIPVGRFVKRGTAVGGAPAVATLESSDTEDLIAGILLRPVVHRPNAESELASAVDVIPAEAMADVAFDGDVYMLNSGPGAASAGGVVHVVRVTTGGDEVGEARASASGVAQVATITPGAGQNSVTVAIEIRILTGARAGYSKVLLYQTDASMTATEVCDAFRTDFALDSILSALLTAGGTATMTLTSTDVDTTFEVNAVEGTFTIDEATTAPARYTIPLPIAKAYWAEAVAAGAIGPVHVRM